ncbi:aldo/keto reductase [Novipirellula artificiosorum]|uniref:Putative oxidoreductase n=1 Tax=Novipirellula artificiosorum TaxID=2528016 RepID=A0A5C6E268_9BACT|nr:aldo/keto reductase [Novipirellula artificiosorum]TWU42067.1 putative oxidoreductase [Novipirellula artificiosorum]
MVQVNRRQILGAGAAAATVLGSSAQAVPLDSADVPPPPQIQLGNTGITMSRIGQGTGVHGGKRQSDQTRMGFDDLVALFHHSYERGITFFDLADLYGTHVYFREALRTIPREKVTIMSKMWWRYDGPENATKAPHRKEIVRSTLERFRHEIDTDYLDIVLLHCETTRNWDEQLKPYMDELAAAKEKKQVRAVGVSCHDFGALETAAECPWVDVVLARINRKGGKAAKMDGTTEEVSALLQKMKDNGKAVLGMKIFGEGTLVDQKEECIQFAQGLTAIDAMTIGFQKKEEIDEVLQLIHKYPAQQA